MKAQLETLDAALYVLEAGDVLLLAVSGRRGQTLALEDEVGIVFREFPRLGEDDALRLRGDVDPAPPSLVFLVVEDGHGIVMARPVVQIVAQAAVKPLLRILFRPLRIVAPARQMPEKKVQGLIHEGIQLDAAGYPRRGPGNVTDTRHRQYPCRRRSRRVSSASRMAVDRIQ